MKNLQISILLGILFLPFISCKKEKSSLATAEVSQISARYDKILSESTDLSRFPRTISDKGDLVSTDIYDWTSGFFAGNLWYLYEITGDQKWKKEAVKWTEALDTIQYWTGGHDVGFMINCSYGNGLRLAQKEEYKKVLVQTARSLCKRYSPVTKSIKSWDYRKAWNDTTEWFFPVIIDNMMNLELLFEATKLSGDKTFEEIAIQHANTTMKNHYRPDFSSYHVVDYDTITGNILDKATCQGFTDESSWSRGQSWGLYGFVICYRYTRDLQYLSFAENIADFLLNNPNLPDDKIPYWDYNAPDKVLVAEWKYDPSLYPEILRDASAAAILSSALFELSEYSRAKGAKYREAASAILKSLESPRYFESAKNKYFILDHCVGSLPHGAEIDKPLVYADYYFLEAALRQKKLSAASTIQ
jgi:unsaturated chondroitin disaccharide hydrolase